jgi:hypothetical protein
MAVLTCLAALLTIAHAQTDPLPSWNNEPAKQAILEFVRVTTDKTSPKYVVPEDRIAVFDQDGTTWVSHPMYTQVKKVGTFSDALMAEAKKRGWTVISMKNDWRRIFSFEKLSND